MSERRCRCRRDGDNRPVIAPPRHRATESSLFARQACPVLETSNRLNPGQKLSDARLPANLLEASRRLSQAGIRLASVLNETFNANVPEA